MPTDDDSKAGVVKTVCAFANGEGVSIVFGIDDDYRVVGPPTPKKVLLIAAVIELIVRTGPRLYGSSKPNETRRFDKVLASDVQSARSVNDSSDREPGSAT